MERLTDDLLGEILKKVVNERDRRSCSEVCKQWASVEAITCTSLWVFRPAYLYNMLVRFPNLTTLQFRRTLSDQHLEFIARMCPNLHAFDLQEHYNFDNGFPIFGDDGLCAIANGCRNLTKVCLQGNRRVTDVGVIALIKNAKKLSSLNLSWTDNIVGGGITDDSLKAMGLMGSLTELYLQASYKVTDVGLLYLANGSPSKTLRTLDLAHCYGIAVDEIRFLAQISSLQDLNLSASGAWITDNDCIAISSISSLRRLNLSRMKDVSDEALSALSQNCKNLLEINLNGCVRITGDGIHCFVTHKSLQVLQIIGTDVGVKEVELLLLNCQPLKHLVLDLDLRDEMSTSVKEKIIGRCTIDSVEGDYEDCLNFHLWI